MCTYLVVQLEAILLNTRPDFSELNVGPTAAGLKCRSQVTGQATGQVTGHRPQATSQVIGHRPQVTGYRTYAEKCSFCY